MEISAIANSPAKIRVTAEEVAQANEKSIPINNTADVAERAIKEGTPSLGIGKRLNVLG